ncbi:MAG: type II toxin-antitoxin system RelE/ParE family toxin [Phycisphaerales bacterium]
MIASFGDKATRQLYNTGVRPPRIPPDIARTALRRLDSLNAATQLVDLRSPPGNRLEQLKGDLAGFYSIRVNDQWRIVFRWSGGDAHEVRILDYHD